MRPLARVARFGIVLLQLLVAASATATPAPQVVPVEGLGPMLLVGENGKSARQGYVDSLVQRRLFPGRTEELRAWAARPLQATSLAALRQSGRPLIGIQVSHAGDLVGTPQEKKGRRILARAVERAGGIPVFLPPAGEAAHIAALLGAVDHLLLAGGDDLHPRLYHERIRGSVGINLSRDRYEIDLVKQAVVKKLGITAICRGHQLLNVAFGGRLAQDIIVDGASDHRHATPDFKPVYHTVELAEQSHTAKETGRTRIPIVSLHHQAVIEPGHGLTVVGRSHDGIIEAVEGDSGRIRGYQFHPERSRTPAVRRIFRGMIARAAHAR